MSIFPFTIKKSAKGKKKGLLPVIHHVMFTGSGRAVSVVTAEQSRIPSP